MEKEEKGQSKMRQQATLNYDTETDNFYLTNDEMDNDTSLKALDRFYSYKLSQLNEKDSNQALSHAFNVVRKLTKDPNFTAFTLNEKGEVTTFFSSRPNELSLEDMMATLIAAQSILALKETNYDLKKQWQVTRQAQRKAFLMARQFLKRAAEKPSNVKANKKALALALTTLGALIWRLLK